MPAAGIFYDLGPGVDFTVAQPIGPKLISRPIKEDSRAVVMRQRFAILSANYARLPAYSAWNGNSVIEVRTAGPTVLGEATWIVDETDLQEEGPFDDYTTFTRVYASVPRGRQGHCVAVKNYQECWYTVQNNAIIDESIYSFSSTVRAYEYYSYFLAGDAIPLPTGLTSYPQVPFASVITYQLITVVKQIRGYFGFPYNGYLGNPGNNFAECLISATISPYMGNIFESKLVYG